MRSQKPVEALHRLDARTAQGPSEAKGDTIVKNQTSASKAKKRYTKPLLLSHGDVDSVTQRGGESFVDMPIGTPVDGDIANVAS